MRHATCNVRRVKQFLFFAHNIQLFYAGLGSTVWVPIRKLDKTYSCEGIACNGILKWVGSNDVFEFGSVPDNLTVPLTKRNCIW